MLDLPRPRAYLRRVIAVFTGFHQETDGETTEARQMQTNQQPGATPAPGSQPGASSAQADQGSATQAPQQTAGTPTPRFRDWAAI